MEEETPKISAIEAEFNRIMQSIDAAYIGLDPFQRKEVALLIAENIQRSHIGNISETLFWSRMKNYIASR